MKCKITEPLKCRNVKRENVEMQMGRRRASWTSLAPRKPSSSPPAGLYELVVNEEVETGGCALVKSSRGPTVGSVQKLEGLYESG